MKLLPSLVQAGPTGLSLALTCTLCVLPAAPASADTLPFFGTLTRVNPPAAPGAPCPAGTVTVINTNAPPLFSSTGTSNLGSLLQDNLHCLNPATSTAAGNWTFTFTSGATLYGSYSSISSPGTTPGVFEFVGSYVVTGGSGTLDGWSLAGASGSFTDLGRLDRREAAVANAVGVFRGELTLAPVPEPASWALMLGGAALLALRRLPRRCATADGGAARTPADCTRPNGRLP